MRKNKGFTLIELLAVIVILAVIALIATPIIIGIIEDSKVKAQENSAYGIIDSTKYYYTQSLLKPENSIKYNENIVDKLSYNGEKPKSGSWVSVDKDGNVGVALLYGDKCYLKEYSEEKLKEGDYKNCVVTLPSKKETLINTITKGPIVTSGPGVYKMSDTEYRYRGGCTIQGEYSSYSCADEDPVNNYIQIDGHLYRVISVDNQGVKVVVASPIDGQVPFDRGEVSIASCTSSTCPRYNSNNTYCQNSIVSGVYKGCNVYAALPGITLVNGTVSGTVNDNSTIYNYLNITGTDPALLALKNRSKTATWNIGPVFSSSHYSVSLMRTDESKYTASFKIGLMNNSDYSQTSTDSICQTTMETGAGSIIECVNQNWLYKGYNGYWYPWTLNAVGGGSQHWFVSFHYGILTTNFPMIADRLNPVAYLSSDELVKSGDGTSSNPWIIE